MKSPKKKEKNMLTDDQIARVLLDLNEANELNAHFTYILSGSASMQINFGGINFWDSNADPQFDTPEELKKHLIKELKNLKEIIQKFIDAGLI